ncbi:AMP-binding protein [uncultured Methanospirillum sp.]|uniref:AMP-binding protein n=1 Tax=uncultured Methanospirillum sp. TaxID=262503 RepID=UPI0029C6A69B|nr:AMP-binding protein [uncultured Methanospirillum sp.]
MAEQKAPELSYSCGTSDFPLMGATIGEMLDQICARQPDVEALVAPFQDVRLTYRQFREEVDRIARGLMAMDINKGDRVGIWAMNYAEWTMVQFATAKIGAIMVNINPSYRTFELEYCLKQSEVKLLILQGRFKTSDYVGMFYEACPEAYESRAGRLLSEKFPFLKTIVFMGEIPYNGMYSWSDLLSRGESISPEELQERADSLTFDDPINIQYTSGTTGYPKGVVLTHHGVMNNGYMIGKGMGFTDKDRLCIPVPFYHCFGMVLSNMACTTNGATMVIPAPTFDPEAVLKTIEAERCTAVHGVPTMFIAELRHPDFAKYDLRSLRTGIMAGSPCPIEVMKEVATKMHMSEVVIVYGQTETSPGVTMTTTKDPLEKRVTTVGRVFPHTELKIIDSETKKIVQMGEIGEICARGYMAMRCYYNNPTATRQTKDENGWIHTGDLGSFDREGYVHIEGRLKDMVIRGGENIYPREIEEFLHQHKKIADVYVIGVPDEKYGEELMAWIVLEKDTSMTEQEVRDYCTGKIARYKIPRYISFVESVPMSVTGKIQKFKMKEMAIEMLGLESVAHIKTA